MGDEQKYTVKGLMAIVNLDNGTAVHLQHGAPIPSNVDPGHLRHLLDNDLVEESDFVGGLEPVYTGDLSEQLTSRGDGTEPGAGGDDGDGDGPIPAKSASRADWDAYAKSEAGGSLTDDEIAAFSTKEDLRKHYGVS